MENLEDAVALFSPSGEVIFSNAAMRALHFAELPESHPARQLVARTLATPHSAGPVSVAAAGPSRRTSSAELIRHRLVRCGDRSRIPTPSVC